MHRKRYALYVIREWDSIFFIKFLNQLLKKTISKPSHPVIVLSNYYYMK